MNKHHDPNLCKWLAENVMEWMWRKPTNEERKAAEWDRSILLPKGWWIDSKGEKRRSFDPCCNPTDSWMLEQQMAELKWYYISEENQVTFYREYPDRRRGSCSSKGTTRLHNTARAARAGQQLWINDHYGIKEQPR